MDSKTGAVERPYYGRTVVKRDIYLQCGSGLVESGSGSRLAVNTDPDPGLDPKLFSIISHKP